MLALTPTTFTRMSLRGCPARRCETFTAKLSRSVSQMRPQREQCRRAYPAVVAPPVVKKSLSWGGPCWIYHRKTSPGSRVPLGPWGLGLIPSHQRALLELWNKGVRTTRGWSLDLYGRRCSPAGNCWDRLGRTASFATAPGGLSGASFVPQCGGDCMLDTCRELGKMGASGR